MFKFRQIHVHEVLYSLRKLRISKSAGLDNLPPTLIKQGVEEITRPNVLINRSIQEATFPTVEKCANVIPIYKSGERLYLIIIDLSQFCLFCQKSSNVWYINSCMTTWKLIVFFRKISSAFDVDGVQRRPFYILQNVCERT